MKLYKPWLAITASIAVVAIVSIMILKFSGHKDFSNYTVNASITLEVIDLFDRIGYKNQEELRISNGTNGKAVGQVGISNAVCFFVMENNSILGIHILLGHEEDEIRFSLGQQNDPFVTTDLSASLSENKELRKSFESMMDRLKKTDIYTYESITIITEKKILARVQE